MVCIELFLRDPHQNKNPSANCIKTLAKLVLTKKKFRYKDNFFLQIKGTAMGSTMAPNYANLYVGLFEQKFIFNGLQNSFLPSIVLWRRYIDDIFMLWSGTENQLLQFYSFLNTSNEHLHFTVNYDDSCVSILDICIIRDGKK